MYRSALIIDMIKANLLIIPLIMLAYFQADLLTTRLKLSYIYFYLFLFIFAHVASSLTFLLANREEGHPIRKSMVLQGFGPAMSALITALLLWLIPLLRGPFYLLKPIPYWQVWNTPLIIGLVAYIVQMILYQSVNRSIYG